MFNNFWLPLGGLALGLTLISSAASALRLNSDQRCYDNLTQQKAFVQSFPDAKERDKQALYFCSSECYRNRLNNNTDAGFSFSEAHELAKKNCRM